MLWLSSFYKILKVRGIKKFCQETQKGALYQSRGVGWGGRPRHYPIWLCTIWCEGKCESVWSRDGKGNSNGKESILQRAGEHITVRENTLRREICPQEETGEGMWQEVGPGGLEVEFGIMMSTIIREMFDSSSLTLLALFPGPISFCWLWQVFQNRTKKRKIGRAKIR